MARRQARKNGAKTPVRYTEALLAIESSVQGDTPVHRIMSVVGVGSVASSADSEEQHVTLTTQGFRAIWDTGAPRTIVTPAVAEAVGLKPEGMEIVGGVGGTTHEAKATRLVMAISAWHTDTFRPHLQFHLLDRAIIYDWDQSREWNVLIGMDVITRGDFEFVSDRAGRRVVVWRYPSRRRVVKYPRVAHSGGG